jgi:hypothetical protein
MIDENPTFIDALIACAEQMYGVWSYKHGPDQRFPDTESWEDLGRIVKTAEVEWAAVKKHIIGLNAALRDGR